MYCCVASGITTAGNSDPAVPADWEQLSENTGSAVFRDATIAIAVVRSFRKYGFADCCSRHLVNPSSTSALSPCNRMPRSSANGSIAVLKIKIDQTLAGRDRSPAQSTKKQEIQIADVVAVAPDGKGIPFCNRNFARANPLK